MEGISFMSQDENVRKIVNAYSSFKKGDIEAVLRMLTDDVEWITPGPADLIPMAGKRRGKQQVAEFFNTLNQEEEVESFEPQEYITQRDKVVAFVKYRARVRATGKTVEADLLHVFTLTNGKVKSFREYYDTAAALDAYKAAASRSSGA
jgi:ketosteroid isomerase-like protein